MINEANIPLIKIEEDFISRKGANLYLLREDLIHSEVSGNKWRKLKYNLLEAKKLELTQLLTFGGAYSNHIAATAALGKEAGVHTIGIIRGEEVLPLNSTLKLAKENEMFLKYITRNQYSGTNKYDEAFIEELKKEFGNFYLIPEGGSNVFAVKGCSEILRDIDINFDMVCCACGTGGTLAGLIASLNNETEVLGFPALKGGAFLKEDIQGLLDQYAEENNQVIKNNTWQLIMDYHFGGYAKVKPELVDFMKLFRKKHQVALDFIYTGKMLFGIYDLFKNTNQLDGKTIVAIHTGGLQGNKGFEERLKIKY